MQTFSPRAWIWFITGFFVFVVGIAGLVLPFLQGILFMLIGIVMMNRFLEIPWLTRREQQMREWIQRIKQRSRRRIVKSSSR